MPLFDEDFSIFFIKLLVLFSNFFVDDIRFYTYRLYIKNIIIEHGYIKEYKNTYLIILERTFHICNLS